MLLLTPQQAASILDWLGPERPGPLVGQHVALTGHGVILVDRWPEPRVALSATADNLSLAGDPAALTPEEMRAHVAGYLEAPEPFVPLVRAAFPEAPAWDRIIYELEGPPRPVPAVDAVVRRLSVTDAYHLWALSRDSSWISKTWGGPPGLAASGMAWGAFVGERLVSVACVFFVGRELEEIGVVTEPAYRGRGLSRACVHELCGDIIARGHRPSWTTSPDNLASKGVAERLGFTFRRHDLLYAVGIPIPASD